MKRYLLVGMVGLAIVAFFGCAIENAAIKSEKETVTAAVSKAEDNDLKTVMNQEVTEAKAEDILNARTGAGVLNPLSIITLKEENDRIYITVTNPMLTPKGNTEGKGLKLAARLKLASGILDAAKKKPYFAVVQVGDSKAEFSLPNFAKAINEPVVEHIWGYGEADDGTIGYLVLDPNNEWVSYDTDASGNPDLETLAIGLVMYPDKSVAPLKSLGKGKLVQGRHPGLK